MLQCRLQLQLRFQWCVGQGPYDWATSDPDHSLNDRTGYAQAHDTKPGMAPENAW